MLGDFYVRNTTLIKPHDNSNISRCEVEANKLKKKVETIKDAIAAHDDSLFSERTGKLQTGLTCHHKFNSDTLHLISTGIQVNIAQLIEDHETALKKIQGHLFYWFQNQRIKIQKKVGKQKESKKKEFFGCGKSKE